MRGDLVALDLETTGLDAQKDAIIEFGAVRMRNGEIIDTYSVLINPGRPIPPEITVLTGIRDEDFLAKPHKPGEPAQRPAPSINQALPAIRAFVGDATIIGHNIGFDLGFLQQQGIFQTNLSIDTYDLASVLLPQASRYSLSSLSSQLNIELSEAHRALHDARASALLYWALWQKALTIPAAILSEIVSMSLNINWNSRLFFEAARDETKNRQNQVIDNVNNAGGNTPTNTLQTAPQLGGVNQTINSVFGENGTLEVSVPDYERRPQQIAMATSVDEAFKAGRHILVEAGTGTGKSLAYLVPAALIAISKQQRVVVSTNTINLQDQLIENDIPLLAKAINLPFRAAILKGRNNYLCLRHLKSIRQHLPENTDELRVVAKLLIWLYEGGSGDKSEINLRGPAEQAVWQRLSAENDQCSTNLCQSAMHGLCPFFKSRMAAEDAQIIIINHALLMADTNSENNVIPEYEYLVIDEAHNFEDAVTNSVSTRIDESALRRRVDDIANTRRGLLRQIILALKPYIPEKELKSFTVFETNLRSALSALDIHITSLFQSLYRTAVDNGGEPPIYLRLTMTTRQKKSFEESLNAWTIVNEFMTVLEGAVGRLSTALQKQKHHNIPDFDNLVSQLAALSHSFIKLRTDIDRVIQHPEPNGVYWLHVNHNHAVSLNSAPLHVGKIIEQHVWQAKTSVVMTSGTLRTDDNFEYIQSRLGAEHIETLAVDSPFDYRQSTLVFIPNDIPDPNDRTKYQQAVERGLVELAAVLDGRTLALFTSYAQLQQTAQAIRPRLALGGITVYDQLDTSSRKALLDSFKSTEKAVLLGTKSFWEGVDIPNSSLAGLVITKLPFPVPNDPIIAARSEVYNDPFNQFTLPETILRFRQGFGRLIRNKTDRGIVVILDRRLMSKSYGSSFIESLPDCTVQYGSLASLGEAAQKWVAQ